MFSAVFIHLPLSSRKTDGEISSERAREREACRRNGEEGNRKGGREVSIVFRQNGQNKKKQKK